MEYQLRNWYHFTWLCGDHIVEQHVHNLDVANWALGDHPVARVGMGGQQVNTAPEYGKSFDHFAVDYEYPRRRPRLQPCARQIAGCANNVSETIVGTKGTRPPRPRPYRFDRRRPSASASATRSTRTSRSTSTCSTASATGKPINELKHVAESTLTAIMGRMSAYTGKAVTWEQALELQARTPSPSTSTWGSMPEPVVAKPGVTELI